MRLFCAVELSEAVKAEAGQIAARLAEGLGSSATRAVTWVAPPAMHLTVRFIGEADDTLAAEIRRRVGEPFELAPFHVTVSGVGAFPASGPPRVVWLGIREGAAELARVNADLESRFEGLGLSRDDRPFRAHLTLGRVKGPLGPGARQVIASSSAASAGRCPVERVTLFESRLSPSGARYTPLAHGALVLKP
jgi:RNA 2',3'-cyclic 3'-phosphodiesterase